MSVNVYDTVYRNVARKKGETLLRECMVLEVVPAESYPKTKYCMSSSAKTKDTESYVVIDMNKRGSDPFRESGRLWVSNDKIVS